MKLTYWVAKCLHDSDCYSLRGRTKKAVEELRAKAGEGYGPTTKVTVEYTDGFDLLDQCSSEHRHSWEVDAIPVEKF